MVIRYTDKGDGYSVLELMIQNINRTSTLFIKEGERRNKKVLTKSITRSKIKETGRHI